MYSTWYCVSVIALLIVGAFGDVGGPGSFSATLKFACPGSLKSVTTSSTMVTTSDSRELLNSPGLAPDSAESPVRIKYELPVPCRELSPQDDARTAQASAPAS